MAKAPVWPRSGELLEWLLCTAQWGLRAGGEARDYAHFALRQLEVHGHRKQVDALIRQLQATPPRDDLRLLGDCEAIASTTLALGQEASALAAFEVLLPIAARQKRKSDAAFFRNAVSVFRAEHGLLPATERAALPPREQVMSEHALARAALRRGEARVAKAHALAAATLAKAAGWGPTVVALLLEVKAPKEARALWLTLSKEDREGTNVKTLVALGLSAKALPLVKARAEKALRRLVPEEWNLHLVASDLVDAIDELTLLKKPKLAKALLDASLERFATGQFDSRGFASTGAYVSLARVTFRQRGWAAAEPLLKRALEIKGTPRRQALPDAIDAALDMGRYDEALAWAEGLKSPAREEARAEAFFRAERWPELAATLKRLKDPEDAARVAWGFVRQLDKTMK
jgi:hypothetical protein